jgi:hypothetical protein
MHLTMQQNSLLHALQRSLRRKNLRRLRPRFPLIRRHVSSRLRSHDDQYFN